MDNRYLEALWNMFDLTQTWSVIFLSMMLIAYVLYRHSLAQACNEQIAEKNKIRRLCGEQDLPQRPTVLKTTFRYTKYASAAVVVIAFLLVNKFFPSS